MNGFALSVVLLTGLAAHASTTPDAWITVQTKIALVAKTHVSTHGVHVDTIDGQVTLHGKVHSELQKRNAGEMAKSIPGVKSVRNLLQIVAAADEGKVAEVDERIKEKVGALLKEDAALSDSDISVKSVDKGAVLLAGTAKSPAVHLRALESAESVTGVRSVASEVKAAEPAPEPQAAPVETQAKSATRDSWTTAEVKFRLLADGAVPALDVNVDTCRGVVSLFGMVPSTAAREAALADARKVDGVLSVSDELQVVAPTARAAVAAKDEVVEHNVKASFKAHPEFQHVDIAVKNGSVHLTGTVATAWERLAADTAARGAKGVRAVDDDLHLQ